MRIAGAVIVVVAALMVLDEFDVDIGPAIAGLGIAGLASASAPRRSIKDWLSGIFIVAENQYNAGEHVRIAGVEGMVEDFSLRRTMLRDADGTVHTCRTARSSGLEPEPWARSGVVRWRNGEGRGGSGGQSPGSA